jgi:hypothetical protein
LQQSAINEYEKCIKYLKSRRHKKSASILGGGIMGRKKFLCFLMGIFVIIVWIWGIASPALSETLKCKSEWKVVTREDDNLYGIHFYGVTANEGIATCENGETATVKNFSLWYADATKEGVNQSFTTFTFKDSSKIIMKTSSTQIKDLKGEGNWIWEGTGEIINASSRFMGIKGKSSFKGKQLSPDKRSVNEWIITYALPPK